LELRCNDLLSAISEDDWGGPPSAAHADALSEAEASVSFIFVTMVSLMLDSYRILLIVRHRVNEWAMLNTMQSLFRQDDIREGIDELQKRVDTCIAACHVFKFLPNNFVSCTLTISHICLPG
jgi:hypothetical protein